jgi:hypothetical protein
VDLLYQAKAQAFLSTCIAPDARIPYRSLRYFPDSHVVPVFTKDGEVINAGAVEDCLRYIVEVEDAKEQEELELRIYEDERRAFLGDGVESPYKFRRQLMDTSPSVADRTETLSVAQTAKKSTEWGPTFRDRIGGEWPDSAARDRFLDIRHDPKFNKVPGGSLDDAVSESGRTMLGEASDLMSLQAVSGAPVFVDSVLGGSPAKQPPKILPPPPPARAGLDFRPKKVAVLAYQILDKPLMPLDCACMGYYHFSHKVWKDGVGWILRNEFMDIIERAQKLFSVGALYLVVMCC